MTADGRMFGIGLASLRLLEQLQVLLLNMGIVVGPSDARTPRGQPGMDHVAYGYRSLGELLDKYVELKAAGVLPYWSIHHGITVSLYYADPDGNQFVLGSA